MLQKTNSGKKLKHLSATKTLPILPVDPSTIRMNMAIRNDL
jgi:hypothetical protein